MRFPRSRSALPATAATGCSLPGRSSPTPPRWSATTSARCPISPPRSAPRRHAGGRQRIPDPLLQHRNLHARRRGRCAGRDEPRGPARPTSSRCKAGGIVIVNEDAFAAGDLKKAGYAVNPLEDGTLQELPPDPRPDRQAQLPPPPRTRAWAPRTSTAARTCSRWAGLLALWPAARADARAHRRRSSRKKPAVAAGQRPDAQGRLSLRRNHRAFRRAVPGSQGQACPGHVPQDHRQRSDGHRHDRRRAAGRESSSFTAAIRSPPPATFCTHLSAREEFRRDHLPGRGRDRRHRRGHRRQLRRRARLHRHQRAGRRPQEPRRSAWPS